MEVHALPVKEILLVYSFFFFFHSKSNPILFPFSKLLFIQKRKIDSKIMAF